MVYTWKDVGDRPDKVLSKSEKEAIAAEWNRYEKDDKPALDLEQLRMERNSLLSQTDWTQNRDVTLSNDADWKTYRQKLRDITKKYKSLSDVKWPTVPKG